MHPSYLTLKLTNIQIMKLRNTKMDQKLKNIRRYLKIYLIITTHLRDIIEQPIFSGLAIKLAMEERILWKNGTL